MRFLTILAGFLIFGISVSEAHADWLNPTNDEECLAAWRPLIAQRDAARSQRSQCYWDTVSTGNFSMRDLRPVCEDSHGHAVNAFAECSQLAQTYCDADKEAKRRLQTCRARLQNYKERQRALQAQQKEAERIQRENERIARENGQRVAGPTVMERYGILPDGPRNLARDTRRAGERVAWMSGVRMTGDRGAYSLSRAMTIVGSRIIGRMNQRALGELDAALHRFDADNPRPTASQLREFHAQRADLAGQYATHMTRVQNTDYTLPLDDKSAVVGAYAGTIAQLVRMRNSGEIDEPIASLGAAAATFLAARAYREVEERAAQQQGTGVPKAVSAEELRARRQAVLAPVRDERARIVEDEKKQEVISGQQVIGQPSTQGSQPHQCVKLIEPTRRVDPVRGVVHGFVVQNLCPGRFFVCATSTSGSEYVVDVWPSSNPQNAETDGGSITHCADPNAPGFSRLPVPALPEAQTAEEAFRDLRGYEPSSGSGALQ